MFVKITHLTSWVIWKTTLYQWRSVTSIVSEAILLRLLKHSCPLLPSAMFKYLKIDTIIFENFLVIYYNLFCIFELAFRYSILFCVSLLFKLSTNNTCPSSNEEYNAPTGIYVSVGGYLTNLDNKLEIYSRNIVELLTSFFFGGVLSLLLLCCMTTPLACISNTKSIYHTYLECQIYVPWKNWRCDLHWHQ